MSAAVTTNTSRPPRGKVIVFGILFFYPLAGVTYQFLHYLIGLRRLGYDVYYIEDSARPVYDPRLNDMSPDAGPNVKAVAPILDAHGFNGRWAFRGFYPGGKCYGMDEQQILRLYREADAFLNVTGAQEIREEHAAVRRRVYVESDPFWSQVKFRDGDPKMTQHLLAHDAHFTFGENVGEADCRIPLDPRIRWQRTRQAVAIDLWQPNERPVGSAFNTIATWSNSGKSVTFEGEEYFWTKDREFERFIDLPRRRPRSAFEMATSVKDDVRSMLAANGWRQRSSIDLSGDAAAYRDYIRGSRGEFTVARDQYVRPRTGWFSDRTCCYLAAGRPVITQDTGFGKFLPTGRGLFAFRTMDDVLAAVDAIETDPAGHCDAAREIGAEFFTSERVIGDLMEHAGLA